MPVPDVNQNDKHNKLFKVLFVLVLITGLWMRFAPYLSGSSLDTEETHLALNLIKYGYHRLLQPLDFIQTPPIFFLFAAKTFGLIFGYTEYALRAVCFIVCVLTFPLFYTIIHELAKSKVAALVGFFIFAVNATLIFYASQLQPYGADVAAYLLLVFLTLSQNAYVSRNRALLLAVAGGICILFAKFSFIVLLCIAVYMLLNWRIRKKVSRADIMILAAWCMVYLTNYFALSYHHPVVESVPLTYVYGYCPKNIFSPYFAAFLSKTANEVFFTKLLYMSEEYGFAWILLLICVVSFVYSVIKKQYNILIFVCLPILLHLGLSAFKVYPFSYRLVLYLVPCFIFLTAHGIYLIADFLTRKIEISAGIIVAVTCTAFCVKRSFAVFPLNEGEIKPVLTFVNRYPGKHVYITDPLNAYTYSLYRNYVKDSITKALPWDMTPQEYYDLTDDEQTDYLLVYGTVYQFGYGNVLRDLNSKHLVIRNSEEGGYGVSLVKPYRAPVDTAITFKNVDPKITFGNAIAVWGGNVVVDILPLKKGKYKISLISYGTPMAGVFPHLNVFVNEVKAGEFYNTKELSRATFNFEQNVDANAVISINMDNDGSNKSEDRNSFIKKIEITRIK